MCSSRRRRDLPLAHAYAVFLSLFALRIKGLAVYPTPLLDHLDPPSTPPRRKRSVHIRSIVRTSPHRRLTQSSHRTPHYSPITPQHVEKTKSTSRKGLPVPALLAIVGVSRTFHFSPTLNQTNDLTHITWAQSRSSSSVSPYCTCTHAAPAPARNAIITASVLRSSRRCIARVRVRIMGAEQRPSPCHCLSLRQRQWIPRER